ncbi:STAS/SEC14 domain-containing protein [Dyella sp. ASV21]|jgi:hypothetical protein|uniref:STAS/SEC14 domain-containing protein n=1 Tax=Dyella sp. ASV21 TaxID=2795114 RepID=UPI0018EA81E5|nr:STAS/SEC14 domain-containing protein [Dyella sp. ASV21]
MIEQIQDLPPGALGFRAKGQVTAEDYERVIVPDVEAAFAITRKLRLLYHVGPEFTGFAPGAMWEDAMLGFRHFSGWDRVALVTDVPWLRAAALAMGFAVPAQFRVFRNDDYEVALSWMREPRAEPNNGNT